MKKKAKLMITTEDNVVKDPSMVFPSFVKDQLKKHSQRWKEHLKIRRLVKFEGDTFKARKNIAWRSNEILQAFVWGWRQGGTNLQT